MSVIHDANSFKLAMITEDVNGDQTKESFALVCEQAMAALKAHEIGSDFERTYAKLKKTPKDFWVQVQSDMNDNYMIGAFVLARGDIQKDSPLIAWAASNRMEFPGLHEEISLMRALMWAGFDPSTPSNRQGGGFTALHAMCNKQYGTGCHPRAIEHLILGGADVNAATSSGDTPLITLCGHELWHEEMTDSFMLLFEGGADPEQKANDGVGAWSLLQQMERASPNRDRAALIKKLAGE